MCYVCSCTASALILLGESFLSLAFIKQLSHVLFQDHLFSRSLKRTTTMEKCPASLQLQKEEGAMMNNSEMSEGGNPRWQNTHTRRREVH